MANSKKPAGRNGDPEDLPFKEVIRRYDGRWVLLKVTDFDEDHVPSRGQVLAHGTNKHVHAVMRAMASEHERLTGPYYIFEAYPRIRSGEGLKAAIEAAATGGDALARRLW